MAEAVKEQGKNRQQYLRVYCDTADKWKWCLIAANGERCFTTEPYANKGNAVRAAKNLNKLFIVKLEIKIIEK